MHFVLMIIVVCPRLVTFSSIRLNLFRYADRVSPQLVSLPFSPLLLLMNKQQMDNQSIKGKRERFNNKAQVIPQRRNSSPLFTNEMAGAAAASYLCFFN